MTRRDLFLTILAALLLFGHSAWADDCILLSKGFDSSRYEALWTHSPFMAASVEPTQESPAYTLVGLARFDGIAYVSLVDKQTQEHFLLSSDKSNRGLTLVSVELGNDNSSLRVVIQKDGQSILLRFDIPATTVAHSMEGNLAPHIPMPGSAIPIPTPPAGAPVPLVFRPIDSHEIQLSKQQQEVIEGLRKDFVSELGEIPNSTDPRYRAFWEKSQPVIDDRLRTLLGDQIYAQFQAVQ